MSDERSLVWRYAATFATLVSLLLLASGALSGWFAYRETLAAVARLQQAQAGFAASAIADFLSGARAALATSAGKFVDGADPEALRLELASLLRHRPEVTTLRWQGRDGSEGMALARFGVVDGRDWRAPPPAPGAPGGLGSVGFHMGSEPRVVLALATPDGGALRAELNLKSVTEVLQRVAPATDGVPYVIDGQGRLLGHPDLRLVLGRSDLAALPQVQRAMAGGIATPETMTDGRDLGGAPVLTTAAAVAGSGWTVLVEQPLRLALAPVWDAVMRALALMAVGVLAALAVSVVLARRLVRPLRALQAQAIQLADAQAVERVAETGGGELTQLAAQFNRMAARLHDFHTAQEARIAERTAALVAASEAKTRFLAAASHDLRQPVHALTLFAAQLRGRAVPAEAAGIAQQIERSAQALAALVEALLDLSRLDVGGVLARPQPVDLQRLLTRLAAQWQPSADARGLRLRLVLPRRGTTPWTDTDPLLLERILCNLVTNALRHTARGGVLVGCRRHRGSWQIVVADSGCGIAAEDLPHVFDEFFRAPSAPSATAETEVGLGLGLAIVRRLAALLDRSVTLRSRVGHGTVARLELPIVAAPPDAAAPEAFGLRGEGSAVDAAPGLPPLRVLVVDDDATTRDALRGLLQRWDCVVQTAGSADAAVRAAALARPDLVLCDLDLGGGGDGMDVVRRLRIAHGPVCCAYVTGGGSPNRLAAARACGDPVLLKPAAPGRLRALLSHAAQVSATETPTRM
jgi:signal transduction histidine kinase/ActR/RegA family two-component response regulator